MILWLKGYLEHTQQCQPLLRDVWMSERDTRLSASLTPQPQASDVPPSAPQVGGAGQLWRG